MTDRYRKFLVLFFVVWVTILAAILISRNSEARESRIEDRYYQEGHDTGAIRNFIAAYCAGKSLDQIIDAVVREFGATNREVRELIEA